MKEEEGEREGGRRRGRGKEIMYMYITTKSVRLTTVNSFPTWSLIDFMIGSDSFLEDRLILLYNGDKLIVET